MSDYALQFKILRLRPPASPGPGDQHLQSELQSSGGFGRVYLGQAITLHIDLSNISSGPVNNVGIRVEIQSEHGKAVLLDTMPTAGLPYLGPGQHHTQEVKHEVKDLAQHTVVCFSSYLSPGAAEPRHAPQAFRFNVYNPLVVRTKHRAISGGTVLLEATVENRTHDAMTLQAVELATQAGYSGQRIECPASDGGPLADGAAAAPVLSPDGGAAGFVFRLQREWGGGAGGAGLKASPSRGGGGDDGAALGRLDIRWADPLGDPARLQTQIIAGAPRPDRELRLELVGLPQEINLAEPFDARFEIVNAVDRRMGPVKVSYCPPASKIGGGGEEQHAPREEGIVMDGIQEVRVAEILPVGRTPVLLRLLPRAAGRQLLQGIMVTDDLDGRIFDTMYAYEVYVNFENSSSSTRSAEK